MEDVQMTKKITYADPQNPCS